MARVAKHQWDIQPTWWLLFTPMLLRGSDSLSTSRHICLLENYQHVQGPYFSALLDQLLTEQTNIRQRNLVYCTSHKDVEALQQQRYSKESMDVILDELTDTLDLDHTELIVLDEWNPVSLQETIFASSSNNINPKIPSILWVQGQNAFWTRHLLRTSGLDRMIQQYCCGGGGNGSQDCIFVGEGAGARCASSTMAVAHIYGDDPRASPELQVQGLNLLGDDRWVSFGVDRETLESHSKTKDVVSNVEVCEKNQVFVWSQSNDAQEKATATTFIMTPHQKGTIERYTTPEPLPPLFTSTSSSSSPSSSPSSKEGVACYGEPSIDPSRAIQNVLGDSEWLEEFS
jgi:hypothetical protein